MHVMFIHPNFPAQFGHIAHHLATQLGWQMHVHHVDRHDAPQAAVQPHQLQTQRRSAAEDVLQSRHAKVLMDHMAAIYRGMRTVPQIKPDLVVGHMSYGTMLYLRNLYNCPFIGYYEVLPAPFWGDGLILRQEFPPPEGVRLFNATYHTLTLLHLHDCRCRLHADALPVEDLPEGIAVQAARDLRRRRLSTSSSAANCRVRSSFAAADRAGDARGDVCVARPGVGPRLRYFHEGGEKDLSGDPERGVPDRRQRPHQLRPRDRRTSATAPSRIGCWRRTITICPSSISWA